MEEETARASTSPTLEENLYRDSGYASLNGIASNPLSFPKQDSSTSVVPGRRSPIRALDDSTVTNLINSSRNSITVLADTAGKAAAISTPAPTYRHRHRTKFKAASITSCHCDHSASASRNSTSQPSLARTRSIDTLNGAASSLHGSSINASVS